MSSDLPSSLTPQQLAYLEAHLSDSRGPHVIAVSILLIVLSIVAVVLRFVARNIRNLPWMVDDYFMLPALFFTILLCLENIICVHFGSGRHIRAVGLENGIRALKCIYFLSITYGPVHFFIKMSILLLYRRIFTTVNRVFVIGLHTIMIYTTAWFLTTLLLCIFQCTPISFFWRQVLPEPPQGHCIPLVPAQVSMNILNTIGDIATLILPGLALWKLQMSTGKKVAVAAIFLIGIFAVVAGVVRIFMVYEQGPDFTWDDSELVIWTAIEPAIGILCACFPVIAPAFSRNLLKQRFGSGPGGSSLRKIFRSKGSQNGKTDDNMPLSYISRTYSNTKEKTPHPFVQLNDSNSDKEGRLVVQPNSDNSTSVTSPYRQTVPEEMSMEPDEAFPTESIYTKSDTEWVAEPMPRHG